MGGCAQASRVKHSNREVTITAQTCLPSRHLSHHREGGFEAKNPAGYTSDANKLQVGSQWQAKQCSLNFPKGPPKMMTEVYCWPAIATASSLTLPNLKYKKLLWGSYSTATGILPSVSTDWSHMGNLSTSLNNQRWHKFELCFRILMLGSTPTPLSRKNSL